MIANPTVNYTSPNATGTLTFTPQADQFGSALITVVVQDNGGTSNWGNDSITNTFTVTVQAVNDAPTLNALTNLTLPEDASLQTVNLSGITPGPSNETGQSMTITATSGNPALIPNPTINYTSSNATGTLTFTRRRANPGRPSLRLWLKITAALPAAASIQSPIPSPCRFSKPTTHRRSRP